MFVYKKLKASDAGITAFEAHKEYTSGEVYFGRYSSASKDSYSLFNLNNELEYFHLDNSFYKNPIFNIGNLNGGINYIDQEKRLYDKVAIVSISQKEFGSAIQKGTVTVDSTYIDDSKGNLYKSTDTLSNYPLDKERVLYVGPVKGFKRTDLTRDLKTGELLVNPPLEYNATQTDDSLYANHIIFNSSSIEHISDLNCTAIQLATGSVKVPHSSNFNFNNDDFAITFYYKSNNTTDKIIIDKSTSQPSILAATNTNLGSQTTEEKVNSTPYEITVGSDVTFKRTDIDGVTSQVAAGSISTNTLYHIACVKTGSDLKVYVNGTQAGTGTDNTNICRNKSDVLIGRTEDVEAQVSQLMIWNRGLSTTEIRNVSESIVGSPYVGNVFYENGLITFTSPKINSDFASVSSTTDTFDLLATGWIEGDTTTQNVTFPTFNGEFTFFNLEEDWFTYNYTVNFSAFDNLKVDQSLSPIPTYYTTTNIIGLHNPQYVGYQNVTFNPLTSSQDDTYTTHTELSNIFSPITGSEGTGSGEKGVDDDSYTTVTNPFDAGFSLDIHLAENQTVTGSFTIDPISISSIFTEKWTKYRLSSWEGITDIDTETNFNISSDAEGLVFQADPFSSSNPDGKIAITGSEGFISIFSTTNLTENIRYPYLESEVTPGTAWNYSYVNEFQLTTGTSKYFSLSDFYTGDNWTGGDHSGNPAGGIGYGIDIPDNYFDSGSASNRFGLFRVFNGASIHKESIRTDNFGSDNSFFLGPGAYSAKYFSRMYKSPGNLYFRCDFYAEVDGSSTGDATAWLQYRVVNNTTSTVYQNWANILGTTNNVSITTTSTGLHTLTGYIPYYKYFIGQSSYTNIPRIDFRIKFEQDSGAPKIIMTGGTPPKVRCYDQQYEPGFKDRLIIESDTFSVNEDELIKYTFNGIDISETYNNVLDFPNTYVSSGSATDAIAISNNSGANSELADLQLVIQLVGPSGIVVAHHEFNTSDSVSADDEDLIGHYTAASTGNHYFKIFLGIPSDNPYQGNMQPAYIHAFEGFGLSNVFIQKYTPTDTFDVTGYNGPAYDEFFIEFGTSTNTDATLDQSATYDDDNANLLGSLPSSLTETNVDGSDLSVVFNEPLIVTESLGVTASFDRGNYISGSASIDIAESDYGIYFIDDLGISAVSYGSDDTTRYLSQPNGEKVKITTKVDGTVLDTRYVVANGSPANVNAFSSGELELGVLNDSNNVSFEFTIVSGSNNDLAPVFKNKGFLLNDINIRRITSSNELSLTNGESFSDTEIPSEGAINSIDYFAIYANHPNAGNSNLPFTNVSDDADESIYTFANLASPNSLVGTDTTATLDEYFFITESITVAIPRDVGPFDVFHTNYITTLVPGKEYDITWTGTLSTLGDSVSDQGAGIRILDVSNNILKEAYTEGANLDLSSTNELDFTDYRVTENTVLKVITFISGASSGLYPDGIVSSSITASFNTLTVTIDAKSGSYFSTEDVTVADFTVISGSEDWIYNWTGDGENGDYTASFTSPTDTLHITSAHDSYTGNNPSLDTGEFILTGVQLTGTKLEVSEPLFITASSVISGTAPSTIEVVDEVLPIPVNPFSIDSTPDENWLGYTFDYVNPVDGETETLTVTAIDTNNNTITVNNGGGTYQVGTFNDQDPQPVSLTYNTTTTSGGSVNFKNTHLIFENEFHCTVEPDEFNFTLNPTARKYKTIERGELANFATGSNFRPYVTTIGLYNEEGELLVVGKLAQPVRTSEETDTTFVVRFDT